MTESREIMAIADVKNNAALIADCARLGYLQPDWKILDPTYGLGRFWTKWVPRNLIACDLDPNKSPIASADFRNLPWADEEFDAVVFDPPYKYNGTPAHASDSDYGVDVPKISWRETDQLITDGITECTRVLRLKGTLLVKCQDQVVSGRVRWQTTKFTEHAARAGCRLEDMLLLPGYRSQPGERRQVHARRNYSSLLVFKKISRTKG